MSRLVHCDPFVSRGIVSAEGGYALNASFPEIEQRATRFMKHKRSDLRLTLVGLGDVGGTLLTALKLLGDEIAEIGIYDPYTPLMDRYEMELGQVLDRPVPVVVPRAPERLFDCDVFLFAATAGVPPLGAQGDVRMQQLESNRELVGTYARQARKAGFSGLFCQISDPVDLLARSVYLQSNCNDDGIYDWKGLLPEQIVGFGLGVMAARAKYIARKRNLEEDRIAVFGPHGEGLVVANDCLEYDEALSLELTRQTVAANRKVRELGFKPYIAPALSSACLSLLNLLRGKPFYGAIPTGGVYFGWQALWGEAGPQPVERILHPQLRTRIEQARKHLEEMEPLCRA